MMMLHPDVQEAWVMLAQIANLDLKPHHHYCHVDVLRQEAFGRAVGRTLVVLVAVTALQDE